MKETSFVFIYFLLLLLSIYYRSGLHNHILLAIFSTLLRFSTWNIKDLPSYILSSLSPSILLFFSPSAISFLSYCIFCR